MQNKTICPFCKIQFKSPQSRGSHQVFCKDNPDRKDLSGKNNPMFGKSGKNQWDNFDWSTVPFDELSKGKRRERLFEAANNSCSHCGFNTLREDGGRILEIDHIDGDPENNSENNLRVLCPNCHALTPTYKNWGNRGNLKHSPRIRRGSKAFTIR